MGIVKRIEVKFCKMEVAEHNSNTHTHTHTHTNETSQLINAPLGALLMTVTPNVPKLYMILLLLF